MCSESEHSSGGNEVVRFIIVVSGLMLGACSPSFEETLAGTWQCQPSGQEADAPMQMTHVLTYTRDGKVNGSIRVVEQAEDKTAVLRGKVSGTWKYDGESVIHTTAEEFQDLKIGEKLVPKDQVSPMVLAGFRPENTYDVLIDIKGDDLTWFEDEAKAKPVAKCKRQS